MLKNALISVSIWPTTHLKMNFEQKMLGCVYSLRAQQMRGYHVATSRVQNSAQVSSCTLVFVRYPQFVYSLAARHRMNELRNQNKKSGHFSTISFIYKILYKK
jgi:hypothetical protein